MIGKYLFSTLAVFGAVALVIGMTLKVVEHSAASPILGATGLYLIGLVVLFIFYAIGRADENAVSK